MNIYYILKRRRDKEHSKYVALELHFAQMNGWCSICVCCWGHSCEMS